MKFISNITVEQAIRDAKRLLEGELRSSVRNTAEENYAQYIDSKPLLFSNENNAYLREVVDNKKDFNALVVAGAFDQIIDLALIGAKEIFAIDINQLQLYVGVLKSLAVEQMSYRTFYETFCDAQSKRCMDKKRVLNLFKGNHDPIIEAVGMFWKTLFEVKTSLEIRKNYIMSEESFIINGSNRILFFEYLNDTHSFELAKKRLRNVKVHLMVGDFFNQSPTLVNGEKVDIILCSNLYNFTTPENLEIVMEKNIFPLLKDGGILCHYVIQIPYYWFVDFHRTDGKLVSARPWEYNPIYINEIQTMVAMTKELFCNLKKQYSFDLLAVETGKGFSYVFNTNTDTIIAVHK